MSFEEGGLGMLERMEGPGCSGRAGEDVPSVPAGGAAKELKHTGWGWVRRCWGPRPPALTFLIFVLLIVLLL